MKIELHVSRIEYHDLQARVTFEPSWDHTAVLSDDDRDLLNSLPGTWTVLVGQENSHDETVKAAIQNLERAATAIAEAARYQTEVATNQP